MVAPILNKILKSKIEEVIEKAQCGFRKDKGSRDAIILTRIISERLLDVIEDVCLFSIDFECVD